jgi:hypothetical protein
MQAMTTAALVYCPELPLTGLRQSMHNPTVPLNIHDIFGSPAISGNDRGVGNNITRSLISDAIKRLHTSSIDLVFNDSDSFPQMPGIQVLPSNKTQYWQFGAIYENEGTIQGIYILYYLQSTLLTLLYDRYL